MSIDSEWIKKKVQNGGNMQSIAKEIAWNVFFLLKQWEMDHIYS